jgi:MFS superfamily sulfate permease-like transporter
VKQFSESVVGGFAFGIGFTIAWNIVGPILGWLAGKV